MLALISPAKTLDYTTALPTDTHTQPRLLAQSQQLIEICRQLSATEIASLMTVSEKIANLNVERFRDWNLDFDFSNTKTPKQAIIRKEDSQELLFSCF